eukprot:COSAG01_NODE_7629_length_3121_cov_5.073792_3_plen_86_part_00
MELGRLRRRFTCVTPALITKSTGGFRIVGDADAESVSAVASRYAVYRPQYGCGSREWDREVQKRREISAVLMMSQPILSARTRMS